MISEGGRGRRLREAFERRVREALIDNVNQLVDEEKQEIELQEKQDSPAIKFIKDRFKARVCDSFVERQQLATADEIDHDGPAGPAANTDRICKCGYAESKHEDTGPSLHSFPPAAARSAPAPVPAPTTNAFGKITFYPSHMVYRKAAKYVRLSDESDMTNVLSLVKDYWRLVKKPELKPDVILSVVGGGRFFRLSDSRKKAIFDQGLIKVVTMTNGWILSRGTNNGVPKAVGDAVREGQSLQYDANGEITRTIHCIGITPWHIIKGREELINPDPNKLAEVKYRVDRFNLQPNLYSLNPDHSHFLFVDDGNVEGEKNIEKFHATLESQLSSAYSCPVICLLIDGGVKSFAQICDTLEMGTPVLICKGTGRFSDILAEGVTLFAKMRPQSPQDVNFRNQLKSAIQDNLDFVASTFGERNQIDAFRKLFDKVVEIVVGYSRQLTVFDVDKEALDVKIMGFLLDRKRESQSVTDRLALALRWDASTIAASKIFTDPKFVDIDKTKLAELLETALIDDQVEFVKLFADYGALDTGKFLSVLQLRTLYIKSLKRKEALYLSLMMKRMKIWVKDGEIRLCNIHAIIKTFTRLYVNTLYSNDKPGEPTVNKHFEHPFLELFIWAVLLNRKRLALFFWENCSEPLSVALLGCLLCTDMKSRMKSIFEPIVEDFRELKKELQKVAVGIVDQAYIIDREKAMLLVQRPIKSIGRLNSLGVAGIANARAYFNSTCCQQVIGEEWKRGFDADGLSIALSTFLFVPLFVSIRFDNDEEALAIQLLSDSYNQVENVFRPLLSTNGASGTDIAQLKAANASNLPAPRGSIKFHPSSDSDPYHTITNAGDDPLRNNIARPFIECFPTVVRTTVYKIFTFYTSPVVKFILHMTFFLLYLVLYAGVMLFYYPTVENYWRAEWQEILLYLWQVTFVCEMYRTIMTTPGDSALAQFQDWWRNGAFGTWNRMDIWSIFFSAVAISLRWSAVTFPFARLFMLIAMFLYFQRIYKIHFVSSYLGPKVIMLKKMSVDLLMFLLVFTVFMVAYSISVQSLIHPNRTLYWGVGWDLFQQGIWETFGEPADETRKGLVDNCTETELSFPPPGSWDCFLRVYPVPIFLAIYLFFGSILLVNMLIAVFAHVFEEVQANSTEIWRYQMYFLLHEFDEKPFLPPPFILINHAWRMIKYACRIFSKSSPAKIVINGQTITKNELKFLEIFERICRRNVVDSLRLAEKSKIDSCVTERQNAENKMMEANESVAQLSDERTLSVSASNSMSDLRGL